MARPNGGERARPRGAAAADRVLVVGAGRLGRALGAALRAQGVDTELVGWRAGRRVGLPVGATIVLIATRDDEIETAAVRAADEVRPAVVLHCAGARGPEALAPARRRGTAVGQLHPLVAVASAARPPGFAGGFAHVAGDRRAVRAARRLAERLGMVPFGVPKLRPGLYHAGAALLAGGTVALVGAAVRLLETAGMPRARALRALGALLDSVCCNVRGLGLPRALTGPARRGEHGALARQRALIGRHAPELLGLADALVAAQLDLTAGRTATRARPRPPRARGPGRARTGGRRGPGP